MNEIPSSVLAGIASFLLGAIFGILIAVNTLNPKLRIAEAVMQECASLSLTSDEHCKVEAKAVPKTITLNGATQ